MSGNVEEEVLVLGCRVFWSMWTWKAHYHHNWLVGSVLLGLSEEGQRVVGDEVREVVFGVVKPVLDLVAVDIQGVVVKPGVPDQS